MGTQKEEVVVKLSRINLSVIVLFFTFVSSALSASSTEFRLCIDQVHGYWVTFTELSIRNVSNANDSDLVNGKTVGSFSFLISYDAECLQFIEARKGNMLVELRMGIF